MDVASCVAERAGRVLLRLAEMQFWPAGTMTGQTVAPLDVVDGSARDRDIGLGAVVKDQ